MASRREFLKAISLGTLAASAPAKAMRLIARYAGPAVGPGRHDSGTLTLTYNGWPPGVALRLFDPIVGCVNGSAFGGFAARTLLFRSASWSSSGGPYPLGVPIIGTLRLVAEYRSEDGRGDQFGRHAIRCQSRMAIYWTWGPFYREVEVARLPLADKIVFAPDEPWR